MITTVHKGNEPVFSIIICSLEQRKNFLDRLIERLTPQYSDKLEVLVNTDTGDASIGKKRNDLLDAATSAYTAFCDDDDLVSPDYVSRIVTALKSKPDCVGMEGIITVNGTNPRIFIHSLRYKEWFERRNIFYRNPNHLNPVRKDLSQQVRFPEISSGEDHDFSRRLLPLLKTEVYLKGPVYFYEYRNK